MTIGKRNSGRGGYSGRFDNRSSAGGMDFGMNANITEALLTLGIQAHQMLNQQTNYAGPSLQLNPSRTQGGPNPPRTQGGRQRTSEYRKKRFLVKKATSYQKRTLLYRCLFCSEITHNRTGHLEHMKTKKHLDAVLDREAYLTDKLRKIVVKLQEQSIENERKFDRASLKFCQVCCSNYTGTRANHKETVLHKEYLFMTEVQCLDCRKIFYSRFRFEKHLLSLDHIRNRHYLQMQKKDYVVQNEMLELKPYKPNQVTSPEFVGDVRAFYCQICEELLLYQDTSRTKHCQSENHYEKFKEYAKKKLAEMEKNPNKPNQETEQKDEPMEEEGNDADEHAAEGEDENMEGEATENVDEAEKVEDDEAEDVGDNEAEDVGDDEAENVGDDEAENVGDDEAENVGDDEAEGVGDEEAGDVEEEAEDVQDEDVQHGEDGDIAEDKVENAEEDVEGEDAENEGEEADNLDANDEELDFEAETHQTSPAKGKASLTTERLTRRSLRKK